MSAQEVKPWTRPASVPIPTVWWRCQGRTKGSDGKVTKFKIQDVTEDMHEEIVQIMLTVFMKDDIRTQKLKFFEDEVSVKEYEVLWRRNLKQNMSLVILVDDDETSERRIAGFNILTVTRRSDKVVADKFKGEKMRTFMRLIEYAMKDLDVFELFGVDEILSAAGLVILQDFRGQGLCVELLKARYDLGRAVGLKATLTRFGPQAAQSAALKAGLEILNEVVYEDYRDNGKQVFPNMPSKYYRVMGSKIENQNIYEEIIKK